MTASREVIRLSRSYNPSASGLRTARTSSARSATGGFTRNGGALKIGRSQSMSSRANRRTIATGVSADWESWNGAGTGIMR